MPSLERRRHVLTLLVLAALVAACLGALAWQHLHAPRLPTLDLTGVEPTIVQAIEEAQESVIREPDSPRTWGKLGLVLRAHRFIAEADQCFAQAERLDPVEPRWPYFRGVRLYTDEPAASVPFLRRAAELCEQRDPANTAPRLLAAEVLLELGQVDEAHEHCLRVLKRQPNNPRVLFALGLIALSRDELADSVGYFRRCADSPFTRKRAAIQLATAYQRQGNSQAAAEQTSRALQLPTDLPWTDPYVAECQALNVSRESQFTRAGQLQQQGRHAESVQLLRRLVEEAPGDAHALAELGFALLQSGDLPGALQVLQDAVHKYPTHVRAQYVLSVALWQQAEQLHRRGQRTQALEQYAAAAASARRAIGLQPDHGFAHLYLGLSLKAFGRPTEALDELRRARECQPDAPETHLRLAEALAEQGQELEALRVLLPAVEGDASAGLLCARLYLQVGLRKLLGAYP